MDLISRKGYFYFYPTSMIQKITLLLLIQIIYLSPIKGNGNLNNSPQNKDNKAAVTAIDPNKLIQLWYHGKSGSQKKVYRYDIYTVTTWTKLIEQAYINEITNGSKAIAFQLSIMLSSAYHDQTKFEKALPILEKIYFNKQQLSLSQLKNMLIKLEEEYRAFNYIEKAIKIRRERIKNKFINTYWEIYRDCGLIEAAKKDFIQFEPLPPFESESKLIYYVNLGEMYFSLNQYDSAKMIFNQGANFAKELLQKKDLAQNIRVQDLNFWLGCLTGNSVKCDIYRGIYTDAIPKLNFDISMSNHDIDNKIDKMILLSNVLLNKSAYTLAKKYLDSATFYMAGKTIKHMRLNLYDTKSKYFKATGNLDSAVYYLELYNEYNRTLNLSLQKNQSVLLLAELEISNRRAELVASQTSNLKYINQTRTQKQQLLIALFSICIILAFMLGLYLNNKQKLKNKRQIEEQNTVLIENEKRIKLQNTKNEMLLKELHHRVKNNLQVIFSLLNIQKRRNKEEDTKEILSTVQNRIQTMALVHENLYNSSSFELIDISSYIKTLVNHLHSIYKVEGKNIIIEFDIQSKLELPIEQVISLGLIVNEATSNAFKYAYKHRNAGKLDILIEEQAGHIHIELRDDGPGFDVSLVKETSLGIKLIKIMCAQLNATYTMVQDHGVFHKIDFKI